MSMDQMQIVASIGSGGNGQIKRAIVVDPGWTRANPGVKNK